MEVSTQSSLGLLSSHLDGSMPPAELFSVLEMCRVNADSVIALQRQAIEYALAT